MRILYCIPLLYNSGGMERVLTQKVNWLATHTTHEFTILTTECVPEGTSTVHFSLDKRVRVEELNIDFNADYRKPLWSKWLNHQRRMKAYKRALQDYISTHKIDLCVSLGGKEIAFLYTLPCRTIAEMHFAKDQRRQLLMANHIGWLWSWIGKVRTWQLVHAIKPLERLVVLTEYDKADWEKAGCRNVACIPNPCCLDGLEIPMESKKKIVLAVGRLHEQKGFDLLLQAWQPIEKTHSEWTLRIVGEGPKRAELENQIKYLHLQHVVLSGRTNDVVNEYAQASLFVLSSRYEGLPLAMMEAMWSGVPCVAFDCPQGARALIETSRGWLVPNGDVEALAQQIIYCFSHANEAQARAKEAQQFVQEHYSEAQIMPQWVQIIEGK